MGDSCSWFGPLRRCASAAPQLACFLVDDADRHVEEAHLPVSVLGLLDGNGFTGKRAANVDEVALPFDLAVGADLAHRRFGRVIRLGKPRRHDARRGLVDACRHALTKRLTAAVVRCSGAQMPKGEEPARRGLAAVAAWLPEA